MSALVFELKDGMFLVLPSTHPLRFIGLDPAMQGLSCAQLVAQLRRQADALEETGAAVLADEARRNAEWQELREKAARQ